MAGTASCRESLNDHSKAAIATASTSSSVAENVIDELVALTLRGHELAQSSHSSILIKGLIADVYADIKKKLGEDEGKRISELVQQRVMDQVLGGRSIGKEITAKENSQKVDTQSPQKPKLIVYSPELVRELPVHPAAIEAAVYTPNGKMMITVGRDEWVRLWDAKTGELLNQISAEIEGVNSVAVAPDNKTLAIATADGLDFYELMASEPLESWSRVFRAAEVVNYSPDGSKLVSITKDNKILIWKVATKEVLQNVKAHERWINTAVFSPKGDLIVTSSMDNTAKLWKVKTGELVHTFIGHTKEVTSAAFNQDGSLLVTSSMDGTLKLWDLKTKKELFSLDGESEGANYASFSPHRPIILSAFQNGTIKLWHAKTGELIHTLRAHDDWVRTVVFSPDGSNFITGADDKKVKVWSLFNEDLTNGL